MPDIPPDLRATLRAAAASKCSKLLHAELAALDPEGAARLRPQDRQRILRATEVVRATGRPLHLHRGPPRRSLLAEDAWSGIFVAVEDDRLRRRQAERFETMLASGALDEVAALSRRGLDPALPIQRAHGVRHLAKVIDGTATLEEARTATLRETWAYARRQRTWGRHQLAGFRWLAPPEAREAVLGLFRQTSRGAQAASDAP